MTRKIALSLLCLVAMGAFGAQVLNFPLHPKQARSISIGTDAELQMSAGGQPQFEIVCSPEANYAGKEMAEILGKAFGCKLKAIGAPSGKCPAIIIGCEKYAKEAGLDLGKLDRDGFYIRTFKGNVIIFGQDAPVDFKAGRGDMGMKGSLFGTYDFLERFVRLDRLTMGG